MNYRVFSFFFVLVVSFFNIYNDAFAQFVDNAYNERIEQLELEIRRLTGEVETLKYKNKNLEIKLNGLRKETNLRFKELEAKPTSETLLHDAETSPTEDEVSKIITPVTEQNAGTATVLYDAAQANLQRKNYTEAAKNFQTIIDKFPEHELSPNAYYWLGETYYARRDYSKAALTFLEGKKKFPNSTKAGHNLLKLGLSLHYLKQDQEACLTFDEVKKNYLPKDKSLAQSLKNSRKKAKCPIN